MDSGEKKCSNFWSFFRRFLGINNLSTVQILLRISSLFAQIFLFVADTFFVILTALEFSTKWPIFLADLIALIGVTICLLMNFFFRKQVISITLNLIVLSFWLTFVHYQGGGGLLNGAPLAATTATILVGFLYCPAWLNYIWAFFYLLNMITGCVIDIVFTEANSAILVNSYSDTIQYRFKTIEAYICVCSPVLLNVVYFILVEGQKRKSYKAIEKVATAIVHLQFENSAIMKFEKKHSRNCTKLEIEVKKIIENVKSYIPFLPQSIVEQKEEEMEEEEHSSAVSHGSKKSDAPSIQSINSTATPISTPGSTPSGTPNSSVDRGFSRGDFVREVRRFDNVKWSDEKDGKKLDRKKSRYYNKRSIPRNRKGNVGGSVTGSRGGGGRRGKIQFGLNEKNITFMVLQINELQKYFNEMESSNFVQFHTLFLDFLFSIVKKYNGLFNFEEEYVICSWNSVRNVLNHQERACTAAIEIINSLKDDTWKKKIKQITKRSGSKLDLSVLEKISNNITCTVAIHCMTCYSGNMGSSKVKKFQYFFKGDDLEGNKNAIKICKRLSLHYMNKEQSRVVCTDDVKEAIKFVFESRVIDVIINANDKKERKIYKIISKRQIDAESEWMYQLRGGFDKEQKSIDYLESAWNFFLRKEYDTTNKFLTQYLEQDNDSVYLRKKMNMIGKFTEGTTTKVQMTKKENDKSIIIKDETNV